MRALLLVALLAGCAVAPKPRAPTTACPPPVPVPAGLSGHHRPAAIAALEIRVELAREAERRRGDDCAAALREVTAP